MTLDQLLYNISPDRALRDIERLANNAINSFPMTSVQAAGWDEFQDCVSRFYRHAMGVLLGIGNKMPDNPKQHFGMACRLLRKDLGPDADQTAARMAIHGVEGGLPRILRIIALRLGDEHQENVVKAYVAEYWNSLSIPEKLAASEEYLKKFGAYLPEDIVNDGAPRLRAFLPRFLEAHPMLMRRLQNTGR